MTLYCSQCGTQFEDGADFCYRCGALISTAIDIDENGRLSPADSSATRLCPSCGHSNPFNDTVCESCGAAMPSMEGSLPPKKLGAKEYAALAAGLIAGVPGLCGLGHIIMGMYSRGLMYIGMSAIILYVQLSIGFGASTTQGLIFRVLGFMLFFHSSLDLFRVVYTPTPEKKEERRWPTTGRRSTAPRSSRRSSGTPEPVPSSRIGR